MDEQHKQAITLLDKVRMYCDKPDEPAAQQLKVEAQKLIDMFEMQKNAYDIENQAKRIQDAVLSMTEADISPGDRDDIKDRTDEIRFAVRKFR